jgi:hypothetical protein
VLGGLVLLALRPRVVTARVEAAGAPA